MRNNCGETIDTTLGDLVSAVSDAAFALCEDKRVAYLLAGIALEEILQKDACESDEVAEILGGRPPRSVRFH